MSVEQDRDAGAVRADRTNLAIAGVLFTVLLWGSYYPVIEHLLRSWDALTLSCVRNVLAAMTLALLLVVFEGRHAFSAGVPWRRVWIIGFVGVGANILVSAYSVQYAGAVPAALISGTTPAVAALMAHFFYGQRQGRGTWVAIGLAFAGVSLVVLGGGVWDGTFRGGEFLVLVANVTWAWYMFTVQLWLPGFTQLRATTLTMITGALTLVAAFVVMLLTGAGTVAFDLETESLGLIVYSAAISVGMATVLWNFGVSRLGVPVTSLFGNLVPVVAVIITVLWGGTVTWLQAMGGGLVLLGVLSMQFGGRLRRRLPLP